MGTRLLPPAIWASFVIPLDGIYKKINLKGSIIKLAHIAEGKSLLNPKKVEL
jgi:hypothetical protein